MSKFLRHAFLCGAAFASLFASAPSHAQDSSTWQSVRKAGVLRCGAATSPPYVMRDPKTGQYSGMFSEICRAFGEKVLKVKVEFVDTTWDNIVAGLQSDKWDMSLSLNDTPEREKAIAFSKAAIDYSVTLAYNKNNPKLPKAVHAISDIDKPGVIVAVMSGTAQDKAITGVLKQAQVMRLPGYDETRLALMSKRADMLADDNMTNRLLTEAHADWAVTLQPNPPLAQQGICFGVRKETPAADIALLNKFIDDEIKSGEMERLVKASVRETLAQAK
ncbi:ABC transporter substrate-binding protein [Burkholderia sp. Bp9143]|uniref:substrate-binding periplasmic protein n=1 Tax=Burkholderia sp. Bp9143 TaxID=2184574 RepID=UPI0021AB217A|nr:transporter substrate-binding domain-containing protein [Burkholderia sp. Bp9143]